MGKYKKYYRRKYKRTRWSSNITTFAVETLPASPGDFSNTSELVRNPIQTQSTTSQLYTVKNVEVSFNIEASTTGVENIEVVTVYIMFVPQGMNVGTDYHRQHPEYIMAMRYLGNIDNRTDSYRNAVRVKTRLARNLNTGDNIILYITGYNKGDQVLPYDIFGVVRWWTKAN